jgi:lysophospholipid acyltransferase (LPLAT)-like uncharacterized protein
LPGKPEVGNLVPYKKAVKSSKPGIGRWQGITLQSRQISLCRLQASDKGKQPMTVRLQGTLFYGALVLLRKTWKIEIVGRENLDRIYTEGGHCLLCFWHGKYFPIFPLLQGYEACVITNQSKRGAVLTELCRKFGYYNAQIPEIATRNSYSLLREAIGVKNVAGTSVDGPLGPACQVKSSIVRLSSALGYTLLPVSVGIRRKIVMKNRWDKREIPLPFSHICLIFGKPIELPPNLRASQVKVWEERTEQEISTLSLLAERKVENEQRRRTFETKK